MKMTEDYWSGTSVAPFDPEEEVCDEQYTSQWEKQLHYHAMYLQDGAFEFMTPIHFEDGMDFDECDCYYASINDGPSRSATAKKPKRRKSKEQIRDEVRGMLPSCLRETGRKNPDLAVNERPPLRRTVSFSSMPSDSSLYTEAIYECTKESAPGPNVTFEEYATVATIYAIDDYPEDVRASVWMSREELSRCMRRAMVEEMKERRARETETSIVERPVVENTSQKTKEVHMLDDGSDDSFDALDLVKCKNGYTEYTEDVETMPMTMCEVVLSQ